VNAPNAFCWGELATRDPQRAKLFYGGLFGWSMKESTDPMPYTELMNGQQPIGGIMAMEGPQWTGVPPHWLIYFMVDDCDRTAAKAKEAGATFKVPPMDIPRVGRFSVIQDPQGAVFAIIKLTHM
jgi:predicted enzyme related to lactoylglutathione lyase